METNLDPARLPAPYRPVPAWTPPALHKAAPKPKPLRARELVAAVGFALAFDLATWSGERPAAGGIGLALLFTAAPVLLFVAARGWRGSLRLGAISGLLGVVVLRMLLLPTAGAVASGLALLFAFALTLRARRSFVPESLFSALAGVAMLPSRVLALLAGVTEVGRRTRVGRVSLLPVVVPLALCAAFLGVFALANPVVAHGAAVAWSAVGRIISVPSPGRVFFWALALTGAAALLRPSLRMARDSETAEAAGEATATSLLVARNALVGVNVLFLGYNALDAVYLWTGSPPPGVGTQAYAHQGTFWLTVALVMLTAVVGYTFRGALAHDARAALARKLAYAWAAQGLVLALGTYRRITIHIAHTGLSDLRIVGILGTSLVVLGLVLVASKLRTGRTFTWLVRRQLDALAVTLVLYAAFPTHLVSARVNVARIASGEYRPLLHMFRQSKETESAAALVPLLQHPDGRVRQGVAALLEQERTELRARVARERTWRERDVVSRRALAALDTAAPATQAALGDVDRFAARSVLFEISRVAADDRSLEEILAIPAAEGGRSYEERL
jgi:Domain of unknown function (DUF4173)